MTIASDQDWRGYDAIADRYDHVWAGRFEPVGRVLWDLTRPAADAFVLDIGTGTGALPLTLTLRENVRHHGAAVGCDRSMRMLDRARSRVPQLVAVAADALTLPFAADTFDIATASFVLSHVLDYRRMLDEAHRVLKRAGILGLSHVICSALTGGRTAARRLTVVSDTLRRVVHVSPASADRSGQETSMTLHAWLWKRFAGGCHLNRA